MESEMKDKLRGRGTRRLTRVRVMRGERQNLPNQNAHVL